MKKTILTVAVFMATYSVTGVAFAYGGGPGVPPGYGGPVECHMKTIHLPFSHQTIQVPICRPGLHTGWKDRWESFVNRVWHGHGHEDA